MMSIEECRAHIKGSEQYSDEEIDKIRHTLYGLAELALEMWQKEKHPPIEGKS